MLNSAFIDFSDKVSEDTRSLFDLNTKCQNHQMIAESLGFSSEMLAVPQQIHSADITYIDTPGDYIGTDGLITDISEKSGPEELRLENTTFTKISVFMNVFNCHVNRTPCTGKISDIFYKPGKFLNASLDKASEDNERNYIKITNNKGEEIIIVQIAGLIARRIVCNVNKNQDLKKGERIGIIKFGSRVDLYLPKSNKILVSKGQKVIGGETIISNPKNIREITSTVTK